MTDDPGTIEAGVRTTLIELGILTPVTALECLAVELARRLDVGVDDKGLASISRELRLTLERVADQPKPTQDDVDKIADKY